MMKSEPAGRNVISKSKWGILAVAWGGTLVALAFSGHASAQGPDSSANEAQTGAVESATSKLPSEGSEAVGSDSSPNRMMSDSQTDGESHHMHMGMDHGQGDARKQNQCGFENAPSDETGVCPYHARHGNAPFRMGMRGPSMSQGAFHVRGQIEAGVLYPQFHIVQFGRGTTRFDYVNDGGQDNLFTFLRFQLTASLPNRDRVRFLFQPLELETQTILDREINIDGVVFPAQTPLNLRYSFPFYRGSYFFDVFENDSFALFAGAGLQIRNARVDFESGNGEIFVSNRDIGPVPLLSVMGEWSLDAIQRIGFEAEGLAAPGAYINGSDNEVEGLILDASLNYGWEYERFGKALVNIRYLGGGAKGESTSSTPPGDGFNNNFLQFWTLSLGLASPM